MSLDGPAMADGAASVGFSGRHGFKRVNTTIRDEVGCLIAELETNRQANDAMHATPNSRASSAAFAGSRHK